MKQAVGSRNNPISGAGYFLRGLGLIFGKGIKRYVAIPLLINTVLFSGAIYYGWAQLDRLQTMLDSYLPSWLEWLDWLLIPLFVITAALVVFFGFSIVANLIAAPFNGLLAEAVERKLGGSPPESAGGVGRLLKELVRTLFSELRKLVYFILWAIPFLLMLFFLPGIGSVLWFLFMAWMLAVEYGDFPMGNHGLTFPDQRRILAAKRLLGLGFGGMGTVFLMVPGLNFLVIPSGVAGATAMWVEQLQAADTGKA